jgi:hypothetical protein
MFWFDGYRSFLRLPLDLSLACSIEVKAWTSKRIFKASTEAQAPHFSRLNLFSSSFSDVMVLNDIIEQAAGRHSRASDHGGEIFALCHSMFFPKCLTVYQLQ